MGRQIGSPKSRVEKLGVKPGTRVSLVGVDDATFLDELKGRRRRRLDARPAGKRSDLRRDRVREGSSSFKALLPLLAMDGAIWAIRRKGLADASEAATMAAGKAAGLVDVKVARFSETHTAEKFVRPVATRTTAPIITPKANTKVSKKIAMARRRDGAKA